MKSTRNEEQSKNLKQKQNVCSYHCSFILQLWDFINGVAKRGDQRVAVYIKEDSVLLARQSRVFWMSKRLQFSIQLEAWDENFFVLFNTWRYTVWATESTVKWTTNIVLQYTAEMSKANSFIYSLWLKVN